MMPYLRLMVLAICWLPAMVRAELGAWLFDANKSMEAWLANVEPQQVVDDGLVWNLYARNTAGHTECYVLVHGFTAEASHWLRFARHLPRDTCLVIPDLPGFGASQYDASRSYSIVAQTRRLNRLLNHLVPGASWHLMGSSMGGHIVSQFAVLFPDRVKSLVLFDAAGLEAPQMSDTTAFYRTHGYTIFDLQDRAQFDELMQYSMSQPPWVPTLVDDVIAAEFMARRARYRSIFAEVFEKDLLDGQLKSLSMPVLVIWGSEDRMLHVSMAQRFCDEFPRSECEIYEDVGHLPFLEIPAASADRVLRFYASLP